MKQFWVVKCYHCWRELREYINEVLEGNIVVIFVRNINYYHVIQNPQNLIKMLGLLESINHVESSKRLN